MKIQDGLQGIQQILGSGPVAAVSRSTEQQRASQTKLSGGEIGSDRAHLSSAAGLLAKAEVASDARMDKVLSIQSAIAAGTYNVSAGEVAGKLLDSMIKG